MKLPPETELKIVKAIVSIADQPDASVQEAARIAGVEAGYVVHFISEHKDAIVLLGNMTFAYRNPNFEVLRAMAAQPLASSATSNVTNNFRINQGAGSQAAVGQNVTGVSQSLSFSWQELQTEMVKQIEASNLPAEKKSSLIRMVTESAAVATGAGMATWVLDLIAKAW